MTRLYGVAAGEQGTGVGEIYALKSWRSIKEVETVELKGGAKIENVWMRRVGVTITGAEIDVYSVFECDNLNEIR